ncbi:MAG: glycosyltransferase family 39 protein [Anaerolineaceae bacterium]|nr:glycosyltransferase family 39 protein [Anaerolineaceae bacterium]
MGSVDAYLVALGFSIFGEKIWVIRLIQVLLYGLTIIFSYLYVDLAFGNKKMAFISSLFIIFPTVNVVLYTTVSLGGYGEALLLGVLSFYLVELFSRELKDDRYLNSKILGTLGLLLGLGLYINPISLTMIIPACTYLSVIIFRYSTFQKTIKKLLPVFLIGFFLGSSLFWYSLFFSNGFSVIQEIGGSAIAVEETSFLSKSMTHFVSFFLFGPTVIMGLRPPWGVEWIGTYVIPLVVLFWVIIFSFIILKYKSITENSEKILSLIGIMVFVIFGFIFTSFGVDPSGRYFLPLFFPLSVLAGYTIKKFNKKPITILASVVIVFQLYGVIISGLKEPYITTQFYSIAQVDHSRIYELEEFLINEEEYYGFSNYWVSYPLAFISDETIISVPRLPYHNDLRYTDRDNRISKYNDIIENGGSYFYVTTKNYELDNLLRIYFQKQEVNYSYKEIADYHIFYKLSKKITPEELGIDKEFK